MFTPVGAAGGMVSGAALLFIKTAPSQFFKSIVVIGDPNVPSAFRGLYVPPREIVFVVILVSDGG
jgi:hypothetical protein